MDKLQDTITKSGNIYIAHLPGLTQYLEHRSEYDHCHITLLDEIVDKYEMYPTKISFQLEVNKPLVDYLMKFPSSKRSSIQKRYKLVDETFQIDLQERLDLDTFTNWYQHYKEFIFSLEDGRDQIKDPLEWYREKAQEYSAIYFLKDDKLSAGVLVKRFEDRLSISYAWYSDQAKQVGVSSYVVIRLYQEAILRGLKRISFGQDTNLFGGHLPLSLLHYKQSWFTTPVVTRLSEYRSIIINPVIKGPEYTYFLERENKLVQVWVNKC